MSEQTVPVLSCGCVLLVDGGMAQLCPEADRLWTAYLSAIEGPPLDAWLWYPCWLDYWRHLSGWDAVAG